MNEPSHPEDTKLQAVFRYGAFYDLLAYAVFQHRQAAKAAEEADSYTTNRFARASILASALSVECTANCLLATLDIPKALADEVDRMTPLGKIEACLRLHNLSPIARGSREVQLMSELVKIRNDHVHPRASNIPAELSSPEDGDAHWMLPISLEAELWPQLKIPKRPMFWSHESSQAVLKAITEFYRHLFLTLMASVEGDLQPMLSSRLEIGSAHIMAEPDEVRRELEGAKEWGVDLEFFGMFLPSGSAPIPPLRQRGAE